MQRPKILGGLGVLDLELFSRALSYAGCGTNWAEPDRPWVGLQVPCNEVDQQLFRLSTKVILGDGCKAKFWDSAWLDGCAPRDIAPRLYRLAWRKNQSVAEDLNNNNWTRVLWKMTQAEEMVELINLWSLIQEVQLTPRADVLVWRWTASGIYTAKSAYLIQFKGSFCTFNCNAIWKAYVEGKHRFFFAWLLVQSKLLTADKLVIRSWSCNPICPLCDQVPESAVHLCLHCVFAQELWLLVSTWTNGLVTIPAAGLSLELWWNSSVQAVPKEHKRRLADSPLC